MAIAQLLFVSTLYPPVVPGQLSLLGRRPYFRGLFMNTYSKATVLNKEVRAH